MKKAATRVAATLLVAGALTAGAGLAPAAAAPVNTAPAIGGGYMPSPPRSPGMCALARILTPFDKVTIRYWCG